MRTKLLLSLALLLLALLALGEQPALAQGAHAEPLTFSAALALAEQAPEIEAAAAELHRARLELEIARGPVSASVDLSADRTWNLAGGSSSASQAATNTFNASASASFNVVPYGSAADSITRAENAVTRAELSLQATRASVVTTTITQFTTAVRAAQQVAIAELNADLEQQRLAAVQVQRGAGGANDSQVLQAQIDVTTAGNDLADANRAAAAALSDLSSTLGVVVAAVGDSLPATMSVALPESDSTAQRQDVITGELAVAEATMALSSARRDALPTASLDATYNTAADGASFRLGAGFDTRSFQPSLSTSFGLTSPASSGAGGASSSRFGIAVGVSIPLDPTTGKSLEVEELALERAQVNLEQTRTAADAEITGLRRALKAAEEQLQLTQRLVEQTATALATATAQYELGLLSELELRSAEVSLLQAQLRSGQAQDSYLLSAVRLATALALDPLEVLP